MQNISHYRVKWLSVLSLLTASAITRNYEKRIDNHLDTLQQVILQLESYLAAQQGDSANIRRANTTTPTREKSPSSSAAPPAALTPHTEINQSFPTTSDPFDTLTAPKLNNQREEQEKSEPVPAYSPPPEPFSFLTILKFVPLFIVTTLATAASVVLGNIVG